MDVTTQAMNVLAPEPGLTPEAMIGRAVALRDTVRADAPAAEDRGCYSQELHQAFTKAGFYRCLQPRKFGGYQFDIRTFFKVMIEISKGDPGIGWCLTLASGHALQIASCFDEPAQAKIFGPEGHFIAPYSPSGPSPDAECVAVPGGYRVRGKWRYCSGVPYSTHFMGLAPMKGAPHPGGPQKKLVTVVVPREQYEILDDWHDMFGLRGSGSNSVVIKDAVIPPEFVNDRVFASDAAGTTPGRAIHDDPLYGGLFSSFGAGELASTQVGAAWAALEAFEAHIKEAKPLMAPNKYKYQHHDWQRIFGLALSMCNAAEAVLLRVGELYLEFAKAGHFTDKEAMQLWGMEHQAARLAWEAGYECFRAASSQSIRDGQLMQRLFRDFATFRNNPAHQPDMTAARIAQAYFGLPIEDFDLRN
jgi:3-hydroxy-9,10-secoandrosta-1,3,5(10)-triene-9,17-dione monooxygenase